MLHAHFLVVCKHARLNKEPSPSLPDRCCTYRPPLQMHPPIQPDAAMLTQHQFPQMVNADAASIPAAPSFVCI